MYHPFHLYLVARVVYVQRLLLCGCRKNWIAVLICSLVGVVGVQGGVLVAVLMAWSALRMIAKQDVLS